MQEDSNPSTSGHNGNIIVMSLDTGLRMHAHPQHIQGEEIGI